MHALVVDDNKSFCENVGQFVLSHIPRIHHVTVAMDGFEALEILSAQIVDLVLADVRMPRLDGIELATMISRRYPWIKIIFVSAYDDSQYLKQAIRLKAFDYLLKPVDYDELVLIMNQVIDRIEHDQVNERKLSQVNRLTLQRTMLALIEGKPSGFPWDNADLTLDANFYYLVMLHYQHELDIEALIEKYPLQQKQWFVPGQDGISFIIIGQDSLDFQMILHNVGRFIDFFRAKYDISIQALISDVVKEISELSLARDQIETLSEICYFCQDCPMITSQDLQTLCPLDDWSHKMDQIQRAVKNNNPDDLLSLITEYRQAVYQQKKYDRRSTKRLYLVLLQEAAQVMANMGLTMEADFKTDLSIIKIVDDCVSYFELHELACAFLLRWSRYKPQHQDETIQIASAVTAYIDQNYNMNITLDSLSSQLFISRSTLCAAVKRGLGQTVNAYINERRLIQSRYLLLNTDMSIKDIAQESGFTDANYFIKRYKKQFKLTPQADRKRLRRGESDES
ncbi:MAG: response regulator [Bacillota bacterium]|nr:response regulator [Bacillota bacterium]